MCVLSKFSNIFCSETTLPIKAKFHMELSWDRGTKVCSNGPGHMAKMVKTLKNILLRKEKADDLETWYAASGAQVPSGLFKLWLWVDHDLFYGKIKFGP